jgi:TolB-like protein/class 3 adenylate cyclase/Flp pilus assembly protein TadD
MAAPRVERRLAAILAADVAGYSRLMERDEAGTVARLKAIRKELVEPVLERHGGRFVDLKGDGAIVEFGSVVAAVEAAVEIQRAMAEHEADVPEVERIRYRIGINLGDVVVDGSDIYGDGVNVAARIEALCEPGGVWVAARVYDPVRGKLDVPFEPMGRHRVKNIAEPVEAWRVVLKPGQATRAAVWARGGYRRIALPGTAALALLLFLAGGLWWVSIAPSGPDTATAPRLSLVVLPFANLSGDPAQEYFADGITEDLTTDLSRLPGSLVIARNSAFTYKGKAADPKQVGRELGVRYILEGSVRRIGNEVRVNAQLIDAETGGHLWADRFGSDLADLGQLQNEITGRIASSLNVELIEAESRRSLQERPDNPDAVDLTMRGLAVWWRPRSKENNKEARALFEQALRLDPQYPDALAGLAVTHATDVGNGFSEAPEDQLRQAEEAAARALAIDPNHAMAHWARGIVLMLQTRFEAAAQQGKFEEAILAYKAALAANPNFALPRLLIASCLNKLGRFEEALATAREGMRVSPRDPQLNQFYIQASEAALALGRYEDAIEWARKSVDAHPGYVWGYVYLASAYALNGQLMEARTALTTANRLRPGITIADFKRDWIEPSDNAAWVALLERMEGGLREAGMPEGVPALAN